MPTPTIPPTPPTIPPVPSPSGVTGITGPAGVSMVTGASAPVGPVEASLLNSSQTMLLLSSLLYYSAYKRTASVVNNFNTLDPSLFYINEDTVANVVDAGGGADPLTVEYEDILNELKDPRFVPSIATQFETDYLAILNDPTKSTTDIENALRVLFADTRRIHGI